MELGQTLAHLYFNTLILLNFHDFLVDLKITMAMYSPPTTPQLNPDICEDLLH